MKNLFKVTILFFVSTLIISCTTVGTLTQNSVLKTRSHTSSAIFLNKEGVQSGKKVYLDFIDPSGTTNSQSVIGIIKSRIEKGGYIVVYNLDEADISIRGNLRFFTETENYVTEKISKAWDINETTGNFFEEAMAAILTTYQSNVKYDFYDKKENGNTRQSGIAALSSLNQDSGAAVAGGSGGRGTGILLNKGTDYSGAVLGGVIGYAIGGGAVSYLIGGAIIGELTNSIVSKVIRRRDYISIVEVQISEKSKKPIILTDRRIFKQDDYGSRSMNYSDETNWKDYRTKIYTLTQRSFLSKERAIQEISSQIAKSISGML